MKASLDSQKLILKPHSAIVDKYIGKVGTAARTDFDTRVRIDVLASEIKRLRKKKNLTQEQLGELVGVKRSQISRIESSTLNIGLYTIQKVFTALDVKLTFNIEEDITLSV
ncbi:helix-turn-helix domain-containing protein [Myroides sp. N17-2]|uniref:helix-turn-helix domain-containing protein n=1 Tax=Myroides sp. N17-2 TaxID=2030799 RepID=UPI000EFB6F82|nr:helix-turn-helix transcriptional regulator [Myroides sp. N17-2]